MKLIQSFHGLGLIVGQDQRVALWGVFPERWTVTGRDNNKDEKFQLDKASNKLDSHNLDMGRNGAQRAGLNPKC